MRTWTRASSHPPRIREASPHVVSDAAVAPQDGSGPCRSVKHQKNMTGCISLKAHELAMKRVGHLLSSALAAGRAAGRAADET